MDAKLEANVGTTVCAKHGTNFVPTKVDVMIDAKKEANEDEKQDAKMDVKVGVSMGATMDVKQLLQLT